MGYAPLPTIGYPGDRKRDEKKEERRGAGLVSEHIR
jgi:hypothetical protein